MAKTITVIPQTKNIFTTAPIASMAKRRVAGYARVSTDSDEQFTSYEAQVDYYTQFIKSHADWEFVTVYTDEGISGLNTAHREGFNRMVEDALAGRIDLIVTKSVSRFARNTVDSLTTIRKLKDKGVECLFEKENIWTFDSKGELLITIMSSLAQEESRSISENVTWGQRKRFSDGKVSMPYSHFLGYDRGEDGTPVVNQKEAETVRLIFRKFMEGMSAYTIGTFLEEQGILSPAGKNHWTSTTICSILTNEKYKGAALLQKKFTVDFLTKKQKVNEGEVPQYYVEDSHEAIIPPAEFEAVQAEMKRRKQLSRRYSGSGLFTSKIICADCGCCYGQKVWHSNDPGRKIIYRCNDKYKKTNGKPKCETPTLTEDTIKAAFLKAYNILLGSRETILADCEMVATALGDCTEIDKKIAAVTAERDEVVALNKTLITTQASRQGMTPDVLEAYDAKHAEYEERYHKAAEKLDRLLAEREQRLGRQKAIRLFNDSLREQPLVLTEWDPEVWCLLVNKVTVSRDGTLVFSFKGENEITVRAE